MRNGLFRVPSTEDVARRARFLEGIVRLQRNALFIPARAASARFPRRSPARSSVRPFTPRMSKACESCRQNRAAVPMAKPSASGICSTPCRWSVSFPYWKTSPRTCRRRRQSCARPRCTIFDIGVRGPGEMPPASTIGFIFPSRITFSTAPVPTRRFTKTRRCPVAAVTMWKCPAARKKCSRNRRNSKQRVLADLKRRPRSLRKGREFCSWNLPDSSRLCGVRPEPRTGRRRRYRFSREARNSHLGPVGRPEFGPAWEDAMLDGKAAAGRDPGWIRN